MFRWLLALAFLLAPAVSAQEDAPPGGRLLQEEWVALYLQGVKIGWGHETDWAVPGEKGERFVTISESDHATVFDGEVTHEHQRVVEHQDENGCLVAFESRSMESSMETVVKGEVKGDKLVITTLTAGDERPSEQPWQPGVLGTWGERLLTKAQGVAPGTKYEYRLFSTDAMVASTVTVAVIGKEKVKLLDEERELNRLEQTDSEQPGMQYFAWADDQGEILKLEIPVSGGFVILVVPKEVALAESDEEAPDLLSAASVPCDVPIPHPYRLAAATYELSAETGTLEGFEIPAGRQKVLERTPAKIVLRVESTTPEKAETLPAKAPELAEFLEGNAWLQSEDPGIQARAKEALAGETDAWKAAKKLEAWVYENIEDKNYAVSFATAKEVCQTLSGDCTEHAVLLAALARAAGIPSRVASGVLYHEGVFGGHMWTEVHVAGAWHALDATIPAERVDATHITFSVSSLRDETPSKMGMNSSGFVDRLRVSVRSLTVDGREIALGPEFKAHEIKDDVFTHALLGFRVTRPAGWTFRPWAGGPREPVVTIAKEGGEDRITVSAEAMAPGFEFSQITESMTASGEPQDVKEWDVQGRKAWSCRVPAPDEGGSAYAAFVLDDDMLYTILYRGGEEGGKAWSAVVAGLAFEKQP